MVRAEYCYDPGVCYYINVIEEYCPDMELFYQDNR